MITPTLVEADREEESGHFFKRLGELCFHSQNQLQPDTSNAAGISRQLAVSNCYGVTAFADGVGRMPRSDAAARDHGHANC